MWSLCQRSDRGSLAIEDYNTSWRARIRMEPKSFNSPNLFSLTRHLQRPSIRIGVLRTAQNTLIMKDWVAGWPKIGAHRRSGAAYGRLMQVAMQPIKVINVEKGEDGPPASLTYIVHQLQGMSVFLAEEDQRKIIIQMREDFQVILKKLRRREIISPWRSSEQGPACPAYGW